MISKHILCAVLFSLGVMASSDLHAEDATKQSPNTSRGDRMIAAYFKSQTKKISDNCFSEIHSLKDWEAKKGEYRKQLFEMLGLQPLPKKTPLKPTVTGRTEHDDFTVENIHFQSMPGLYVTGNLYLPRGIKKGEKLPTVLYVCGHGRVKKGDVSFGNKTHYQHHGGWFARNGYACFTIDTIQLGELEGMHHGTYRYGKWWWISRGYTPAGVEAWNCIRALDYLQSRPEVDGERIGVTGRSGGGAYSWWVAALDERIKVAVPVAGITSLKNHVVDGTIQGHCDCMFQVNTYMWDYAKIAALVAPRPLLISNSDKDGIFPLDGVVDVYFKARKIYDLYGKLDQYGLQITEGPHKDTQELRIHAFHWFNKFLKGDPAYEKRGQKLINVTAEKFFEPEQLKVFKELPTDEITTTAHDTFTQQAPAPKVPGSTEDFDKQRDGWMTFLKQKTFRGWPEENQSLNLKQAFSVENEGVKFSAIDFTSQAGIPLRLYLAHRAGLKPAELDLVVVNALNQQGWTDFLSSYGSAFKAQLQSEALPAPDAEAFAQNKKMFDSFKWAMAYVAPRGIGRTQWEQSERNTTHIRRRHVLIGQTLDGQRIWDVRRAVQSIRSLPGFQDVQLWMQGEDEMAGIVLYASLFEPNVHRLDLWRLSKTHAETPILLNVLRGLDVPAAVSMATKRSLVRIYQQDEQGWGYPQAVAEKLGLGQKQLQVRKLPEDPDSSKK